MALIYPERILIYNLYSTLSSLIFFASTISDFSLHWDLNWLQIGAARWRYLREFIFLHTPILRTGAGATLFSSSFLLQRRFGIATSGHQWCMRSFDLTNGVMQGRHLTTQMISKLSGFAISPPTLSLISHIGGFQRLVIGTNPAKLWDTRGAFGGLEPDNISPFSQPNVATKHGIYLTIRDVKALLELPILICGNFSSKLI